MKVEVCCGSIDSCFAANDAGANRVELCSALVEGGVTPSLSVVEYACKNLAIDVNVIIRPRGGDFVYSNREIEIMIRDIEYMKSVGVNGVVFGCLTNSGDVDISAMQRLMGASKGISVTFHRAFDLCVNPFISLEEIIGFGCDRLLTSGQAQTAFKGIELLKELNEKASNRIIIMPGCGVNEFNIKKIIDYTLVKEIHFSASVKRLSNFIEISTDVDFGAASSVSCPNIITKLMGIIEK